MIPYQECIHCECADENTWCCLCEKYIHRSGNIIMTSEVPIAVTDVGYER
jgi:hypothetical protein